MYTNRARRAVQISLNNASSPVLRFHPAPPQPLARRGAASAHQAPRCRSAKLPTRHGQSPPQGPQAPATKTASRRVEAGEGSEGSFPSRGSPGLWGEFVSRVFFPEGESGRSVATTCFSQKQGMKKERCPVLTSGFRRLHTCNHLETKPNLLVATPQDRPTFGKQATHRKVQRQIRFATPKRSQLK